MSIKVSNLEFIFKNKDYSFYYNSKLKRFIKVDNKWRGSKCYIKTKDLIPFIKDLYINQKVYK